MKRLLHGALLVTSLALYAASANTQDINVTASQEWRSYVEPLLPIGERLVAQINGPEDAQLRQELYRAAFSALATGYMSMLLTDPEHPDFVPFTGQLLNLLGPNPDNVYYMAPLQDEGIYKVSGFRGSVHTVVFQLAGGNFVPRGDGKILGTTYANYDIDNLHIAKNGAFEVILSHERPKGWKGDWWPLPPQSTSLVVRQIAYDWVNEVDGRLAIERLDRPAIKPRPSPEQIATNLKQLAIWTENYVANSNRIVKFFAQKAATNAVSFIDFGDDGGMPSQKYLEGMFDLQADEALILETEVPKQCEYWSFQLTDERWTSYDWVNRLISINGFQAKRDKDGKFRAVISKQDPGVPNWLDTGGLQRGVIQGRWKKCNSAPMPVATKVKVADVRKYLPADTPIVTAEARDAEIRLRRKAVQMRKRW